MDVVVLSFNHSTQESEAEDLCKSEVNIVYIENSRPQQGLCSEFLSQIKQNMKQNKKALNNKLVYNINKML